MYIARFKTPLLIFGGIFILSVIGWLVYLFLFSFSVISTTPNQGTVSDQQPVFFINTTKQLADTKITATTEPASDIINSVVPDGKRVVVNLNQNLKTNTKYTVTLSTISSKNGQTIDSYSFSFTTVKDDSLLSKEARAIILERQQNQKPKIFNDPVLNILPISDDSFYAKGLVDATPDGEGVVRIEVTLYITPQEANRLGKDKAVEELRTRAATVLQQKGVDLSKYEVIYKVQGP